MAEPTSKTPFVRWRWAYFLTALALMGAAWGVDAIGDERTAHLDWSGWGRAEDIPGMLARDARIASHLRPYVLGALGLDALAFIFFPLGVGSRDRFGLVGTGVGLVLLVSVGYHGWLMFLIRIFTSSSH
jgi:hypothetical protein